MIVLALNCGSSSLKFQLFAMEPGVPRAGGKWLARGLVDRIGPEATLVFQAQQGAELQERAPIPTHESAVQRVLAWLTAGGAHGAGNGCPDRRGRPPGGFMEGSGSRSPS